MAKKQKKIDTSLLSAEQLAELHTLMVAEKLRDKDEHDDYQNIAQLKPRAFTQGSDWSQDDALYNYAKHKDPLGVALLLMSGADGRSQDPALENKSALMGAAQSGNALSVALLCPVSSIDATDDHGRTALHWASMEGAWHSVQALLAAGASPNLRDHDGLSPLEECVRYGGHAWEKIQKNNVVDPSHNGFSLRLMEAKLTQEHDVCLHLLLDCDGVDYKSRGAFPTGIGSMLADKLPLLSRLILDKENEQRLALALQEGAQIAQVSEAGMAPKARKKTL
jgi:hypothetical protein